MSKNQKKKKDEEVLVGEAANNIVFEVLSDEGLSDSNNKLFSEYIKEVLKNKFLQINKTINIDIYGKPTQLKIIQINFNKDDNINYLIQQNSILDFVKQKQQKEIEKINIFGLEKEIEILSQIIKMNQNELFNKIPLIKNILISGITGTGKTLLLQYINQMIEDSIYIDLSLNQEINYCQKVLLIDNLTSQNQNNITNILQSKQIVITASNDKFKNNFYNYFDKEIFLQVPNSCQRLQILEGFAINIFKQIPSQEILKSVNKNLSGFTGADIQKLIKEYIFSCYKDNQTISFNLDLLQKVIKNVHPSGLKELVIDIPEVSWSQIGGNKNVKKEIKQVVDWPLKYAKLYEKLGLKQPSKGILLYGPPGCSKTMLAKAIATESKLNFIPIKGPELFSKYVGDSERNIRNIFKQARTFSPCVIFFDEIDAIGTQRNDSEQDVQNRILTQLLNEMDGIEDLTNVIIIGATNMPQIIDKALMRPGRFDNLIYVQPPDLEGREEIFRIYLQNMRVKGDVDYEKLSQQTDGYSGAEIALICKEAALNTIERNLDVDSDLVIIEQGDIQKALKKVKNRINQEVLQQYEDFKQTVMN